jgi:hypothetical protein
MERTRPQREANERADRVLYLATAEQRLSVQLAEVRLAMAERKRERELQQQQQQLLLQNPTSDSTPTTIS